jgi:hypothetical protein
MAHLEGLLNGVLLIAVAAIGPVLRLDVRQATVVAWSLVVTAYGNVIASALGATFGVRGLTPGGPAINTVVYVTFMIAVVTVVVAMALVTRGARRPRTDRVAARPSS